jgi:hypothetical protein
MRQVLSLLFCLSINMCCTSAKPEMVKSTHENVQRSAVSLTFITGTAGNGVIIHFAKPDIYYVLSAGHLCNVAVDIAYIVDWKTSKSKTRMELANIKAETTQSAIDAGIYCAPSVLQGPSVGIRGRALAADFNKDLSLFSFTSKDSYAISTIDKDIKPVFGQEIYAYGYVYYPGFYNTGLAFFGRTGEVFPMSLNPMTDNAPTIVVQSSLGISHGISGSGVYTLDHRLLGIVSAEASLGRDKPIRLSLFIHPTIIRQFLFEVMTYYKEHKEEKKITPYCASADPVLCDAFLSKKFDINKEIEKEIKRR